MSDNIDPVIRESLRKAILHLQIALPALVEANRITEHESASTPKCPNTVDASVGIQNAFFHAEKALEAWARVCASDEQEPVGGAKALPDIQE